MGFFRTALLLAALTALFMGVGAMLGGRAGAEAAFVFALAMNFGAWWFSDKMVLAHYGAREINKESAPQFYGIVEELAAKAQLPMPKIYVADSPQPNAFATGRSPEHAAVCATTGLLQRLSAREVRAVMAHELSHIKHRDTLIMTITATLAGALSNFARVIMFTGAQSRNGRGNPLGVLLATLLAPFAAMLVQFAISRTREFAADRRGAELSGDPLALASALANLQRGTSRISLPQAEANPAFAHLLIVNPLHEGGIASLFSTHPPMGERIARLRDIANEMGQTQRFTEDAPETRELETAGGHRPGPWG